MNTYSRLLIWIVMGALFTQCVSTGMGKTVQSDEMMRSLNSIKKSVVFAMENKVARRSENGRTYFSPPHRPGKNLTLSSYQQDERAILAITILGDRRPYKVAVGYRIDKRVGGDYKLNRYDMGLAKYYLQKVEEYLASRPEQRDVIDDFRPY